MSHGQAENGSGLAAAATRLRRVLTGLCAFVLLLLLLERAGYAGLYRGGGADAGSLGAALGAQLVFALPAIFYLAALWQLRNAAAAVAAGHTFGAPVVLALKRVGALLVVGAAVTLLVMPVAHRLLAGDYPRLIDFDVTTLIIGALGGALAFLGRLLERAGALESELDEIF